MLVRRWCLSDHQGARGVLVEAMDNAGPNFTPKGCQIAAVMQQSVYQGSIPMSGRRVNHETWRLVDNEQHRIFVKNMQINGLRSDVYRFRLRQLSLNDISRP